MNHHIKCLWVSLTGHAFLALLMCMHLSKNNGLPQLHVSSLAAYAYSVDPMKSTTYVSHQSDKLPMPNKSTLTMIKITQVKKNITTSHATRSSQIIQGSTEQEKIHRILLQLLHNEIASKQVYPENALALNQSGKVTIGFWLQASGAVSDTTIIHSSGYPSIDNAALAAVLAIAPFNMANRYVADAEYFSIEIIFQ